MSPLILECSTITKLGIDVVNTLQIKALPYVIFLVVPLLGRMSDPDEDARSAATNSFATLIKMVPLDVSISRDSLLLLSEFCLGRLPRSSKLPR